MQEKVDQAFIVGIFSPDGKIDDDIASDATQFCNHFLGRVRGILEKDEEKKTLFVGLYNTKIRGSILLLLEEGQTIQAVSGRLGKLPHMFAVSVLTPIYKIFKVHNCSHLVRKIHALMPQKNDQ